MISLILFIVILSAIVGIHEFGHFLFAKLSKTYVYEFSIGMGKKIFGKKKKDSETEFCVRMIPIGGYVMIAGEDVQDDSIPKDRQMCNKNFFQRFMILFAGPLFNFIFAFVILFISALFFGYEISKPYIGDVGEEYPAYQAGLESGDLIVALNDKKVTNWDRGLIILQTSYGEAVKFTVKKQDGSIVSYDVTPEEVTLEDGSTTYVFGISKLDKREHGLIKSLGYAGSRTVSLFGSMWDTLKYLFNGKVSVSELSGPIGIYSIVDTQAGRGVEDILYLVAFLSINVGLINLLPFPAFDGGRIFFLILEKIFRIPIDKKIENMVNTIGFGLILLLMLYVTFNDVLRLIK